jgi:hypothetical protein
MSEQRLYGQHAWHQHHWQQQCLLIDVQLASSRTLAAEQSFSRQKTHCLNQMSEQQTAWVAWSAGDIDNISADDTDGKHSGTA